jgi:hypothetical protein
VLSNNPSISWPLFIFVTVVLTTGITIPTIQSQPSQSGAADVSQIVKQISERVASANPDTSTVFVEQILTELAKQSSQATSQGNILDEIFSQVLTYPYGIESQSFARFASLLSSDSSILLPIVQKILQEQASGKSPIQSIVNIAVQDATGGGRNVNDEIALAAQIIAKQSPGTPVRNIESIIIQMALEISRAQGKAITGQTIFEIASQIKQNPNGILTQAILQLAKQDTQDNGKTGQTANTVKTIVVESKKDNDKKYYPATGMDGKGRSSDPNPSVQLPPVPTPGLPSGVVNAGQPKTLAQSGFQLLDSLLIGLVDGALKQALGDDRYARASEIIKSIDPSDVQAAGTWMGGLLLRITNSGGQSELVRTLDSLHSVVESNPTLLHKMGQLTTLYQTGDAISAVDTSDIIADKIVAGIDPAIAIEETPIPQPEIVTDLPTDEDRTWD